MAIDMEDSFLKRASTISVLTLPVPRQAGSAVNGSNEYTQSWQFAQPDFAPFARTAWNRRANWTEAENQIGFGYLPNLPFEKRHDFTSPGYL
jgi:hypothetical protein